VEVTPLVVLGGNSGEPASWERISMQAPKMKFVLFGSVLILFDGQHETK